jgi:hypothetical protein
VGWYVVYFKARVFDHTGDQESSAAESMKAGIVGVGVSIVQNCVRIWVRGCLGIRVCRSLGDESKDGDFGNMHFALAF